MSFFERVVRERVNESYYGQGKGAGSYAEAWLGAQGAEPEDPYTFELDDIAFRFRVRFGLAGAITSPLAQMSVSWRRDVELSADALEALGRREAAALARCEAAVRVFHRRPSWRTFWLAVKWAFLSGVRRDGDRIYLLGETAVAIDI